MQEADFQKVIDINLKGYFFAAQGAAKEMQKNQPNEKGLRGSIVNIASVAAIMGFAGLVALLRFKRRSCGNVKGNCFGIGAIGNSINNIDPGAIDTPGASHCKYDQKIKRRMLAAIPMKRNGNAEEIANAVLFLASDESCYMTGSNNCG